MNYTPQSFVDGEVLYAAALQEMDEGIQEALEGLDQVNQQVKKAAPRNLLDNSDFRNPVNQRGQTSYTAAGYTIDRWKKGYAEPIVSIVSDGLMLTNADTTRRYIMQSIENFNTSKKHTAAVWLADGTTVCGSFQINAVAGESVDICQWDSNYSGIKIRYSDSINGIEVFLMIGTGETSTIKHVAIYEGEFTLETLPEYQPKGYAAELLECQRYYYKPGAATYYGYSGSDKSIYVAVQMPVIMRIIPTVTIKSIDFRVNGAYSYFIDGVPVTVINSAPKNTLNIKLTDKTFSAAHNTLVGQIQGLELSADL